MQKVRLVAITTPVIDGIKTPGELIAYCARVSNPSNQMNTLTSPKLLKYCVNHKHWSVFETVSVTMEIVTSRDIGRQILRHRSFSFQEFSQRYADPTQDMDYTIREARLQDDKNRQNSLETDDTELHRNWSLMQMDLLEHSTAAYKWAIQNGIAKEQARAVLPEGLIMSKLYMAGTVRSWLHYVSLRKDKATQKEHREIAEMCGIELKRAIPELSDIF